MKKISFFFLVCLLFSLISCEASINGSEIYDIAQDERDAHLCNMDFVFYRDYDSVQEENYWAKVDVSNKLDQAAHFQILLKGGGVALDDFVGNLQMNAGFNIYIEEDDKIIINIWHWQDSSGSWVKCPENDTEFDLGG